MESRPFGGGFSISVCYTICMGRKLCRVCHAEKDLLQFPKNGKDRYGSVIYRPECKPCHSEDKKRRYAKDGKTASRQKAQKKLRYYTDEDFRASSIARSIQWQSDKYANDLEWREWNNKRGYAWKKTPKGKASSQSVCSTRRARLKGAVISDDVLALEKQFRLSMTECANCKTTDRLSLDHIIPLSKGGPHDPSNWQCLCMPCNSAKRDFCLL